MTLAEPALTQAKGKHLALQSSISWVDFSEQDRRKMMEVVALFKQRDTRDELGLGSIRDAFANLFFPGITTLQTRARYMLFIPWLYRKYEQSKIPSSRIAQRLRRDEIRLIHALKGAGEEGVIGQVSGANLQRFPSSIYWNGLRQWGILRYAGSQAQYHRSFDRFHGNQPERTDDGEPIAGWGRAHWNVGRLKPPDGFPDRADFDLTHDEAAFLRERLLLSCHKSVLATLIDRCGPVDDTVTFVWAHPQLSFLTKEQLVWVDHAHRFADAMYGAALLYNLMLAELRRDDELIAWYQERMTAWQEDLKTSWPSFQSWDREAFWRLVRGIGRIPVPTQRFVSRWLDVLLSSIDQTSIAKYATARSLIRNREIWLKRGRSRFASRRHLEMWSGSAGAFTMDYRWSIARRMTNDIIRGLRGGSYAGS